MSRWLIECADVQITIAVQAAAQSLVRAALNGMQPVKVTSDQGIKLSVSYDEGNWQLVDYDADYSRKIKLPGDLIYHLTDRIVFKVSNNATIAHCVHAAAVSHQQGVLVIPANSGSGKSSFTTWLVANGFDYITDELILLDENQGVTGIGRPIQIKSHGLEAVQHLFLHPEHVYNGNLANAVTHEALGGKISTNKTQALTMIVFPQYQAQSDYSLTKLSGAQAGMRLMANYVNARNIDGHGFNSMMSMIRNTPCYSLEYGGFDTLPKNFTEQLISLLAD